MKVSEVIKKLQEIKKEHGDLDVTIDFKDIADFTVLDGGVPI